MTEPGRGRHPDLDTLSEHAAGQLSPEAATAVAEHLSGCPECRLEEKRLARFATIDADAELLAEADWPRAELALQRAFEEKVRPAVAAGTDEAAPAEATPTIAARGRPHARRRGLAPRGRWVAALAAAAAVTLLFVGNMERVSRQPAPGDVPDLLRGGEGGTPGAAAITLLAPLGEVRQAPREFTWRAERPCKTYTLTLFTPELAILLRRDGLTEPRAALPDSVRALLARGKVYVWSVQGQSGLTPAASSPSGWFRIVKR